MLSDSCLPVGIGCLRIASEKERFHSLTSESHCNTIFVLVDGFLAFWDKSVEGMYELRIFVREDKDVLRQRRTDRKGFVRPCRHYSRLMKTQV